jgi:hypothetical protein
VPPPIDLDRSQASMQSTPTRAALALLVTSASGFIIPTVVSHSPHCCIARTDAPNALAGGFGSPVKRENKSFDGKKTFETHMRQYQAHLQLGYPPPNQVDVYVHERGAEKFWFVGKACARDGKLEDGPALSVVLQKRLVLEHAKLLQPRQLGRAKGKLELWCAPPNSEVAVAQRQQGLRHLDGIRKPLEDELSLEDVGFLPEQYTAEDGQGFYARLSADGQPMGGESSVKIISPQEAAAGGMDLSVVPPPS